MGEDSDQEILELDIQSRTWKKLESNMKSAGFREGAVEGKHVSMQTGFNLGYLDGFKFGEYIGKCKGILRCESDLEFSDSRKSTFDEKIVDKMSDEACVLCTQRKTPKTLFNKNISFENIENLISSQQTHLNETINTLRKSDVKSYLENK